MKSRTIVIIVSVVVVAVAGGLWWNARRQANMEGQIQTVRAERGDLTATIGATGTVRANQTAVLAWQTTGTVKSVNVRVGDEVEAGQVLATLEQTSLPQIVILAQAELISAERALDDLLYSNTPSAQAQLAVVNAQEAYDDAKQSRDNLNYDRADSEAIEDAEARYIMAQEQVDRAEKAYKMFAHLPESHPRRAAAYSALYAAKEERDRALASYNWYLGEPDEQEIAGADARLAVAEAQLEDAQREWERLKDGPDPADVAAAQARVTAAQATLNLARLSVPFAGTVTVTNPMPGDQVSPGTVGFRIDDLSRLLVDVQVSEVDINSVKVGQPVVITFDAILSKEYHGRVIEVARVGNVVQGAVEFTVAVELTDADELVKPGMTAAVTIVVKELENVLLVPNRAVRLVNGQRVVYVLHNGEPAMVAITLGASSDVMSEVVRGDLREGDLIILNPPIEFQGDQHPPFIGR